MKKIITFFAIVCSLSFYGCSELDSDSSLNERDQALLVIAASRGDFLVFSHIMNETSYQSGTVNGTFDCANEGGTVTLDAIATVIDGDALNESFFAISSTATFNDCYVPYNVCGQETHFDGTAEFDMSGALDGDSNITLVNSTTDFLNEDGTFNIELVGTSGLTYDLLDSSLSYEYSEGSDVVYSGSLELEGTSIDAAVANDQDSSLCDGLL